MPQREPERQMAEAVGRMQRQFGIRQFRPGQEQVVRSILGGRDVLAIMPTGSGKSLTYQLPSQVLPGITVVVSPLLALIKDQVEKLRARGVEVERLDSSVTARERAASMKRLEAGGRRLVLITPEGAVAPSFRERLAGIPVSLFVVDEAHCVSQWGHDFRPAYVGLREVIEALGRPTVLALTATATPRVREDILGQLRIPDSEIVLLSFDRPNLQFSVLSCGSEEEKLRVLFRKLVRRLPRPGIVYSATVRSVEDIAFLSRKLRVPAEAYHGRMTKTLRDQAQARFMKSGRRVVMIATNAFGLGVDKPDIRFVVHFHVPGSLEQYAQEAGRAGRDGKPSRCILLWSPDDLAIQEYFQEGMYPSSAQVKAVSKALRAWTETEREVGVRALATSSNVGEKRTRVVLSLLVDNGWAQETSSGKFLAAGEPTGRELDSAAKWFDVKRIEDRRRLDALVGYAGTTGCRVRYMLDYFGEPGVERCGRCDNCRAQGVVRLLPGVIDGAAAGPAPGASAGAGEAAAAGTGGSSRSRRRRSRRNRRGRRHGNQPALQTPGSGPTSTGQDFAAIAPEARVPVHEHGLGFRPRSVQPSPDGRPYPQASALAPPAGDGQVPGGPPPNGPQAAIGQEGPEGGKRRRRRRRRRRRGGRGGAGPTGPATNFPATGGAGSGEGHG